MVWGLGGGSPVVLRITHSVEVGEQRTELIEPNIPIFSPFLSSWLLQLLLSHENSSLCWHREWWWDRGGAAFIPLIWGLLGAHVIQALLPSKLCQSPTGILKKILASPFQTLVEDNLHQEEIYCVSRHPLFPWGCCLQQLLMQTHINSKFLWRWLPPVSKSSQEHFWMICFLAIWSLRLP